MNAYTKYQKLYNLRIGFDGLVLTTGYFIKFNILLLRHMMAMLNTIFKSQYLTYTYLTNRSDKLSS